MFKISDYCFELSKPVQRVLLEVTLVDLGPVQGLTTIKGANIHFQFQGNLLSGKPNSVWQPLVTQCSMDIVSNLDSFVHLLVLLNLGSLSCNVKMCTEWVFVFVFVYLLYTAWELSTHHALPPLICVICQRLDFCARFFPHFHLPSQIITWEATKNSPSSILEIC